MEDYCTYMVNNMHTYNFICISTALDCGFDLAKTLKKYVLLYLNTIFRLILIHMSRHMLNHIYYTKSSELIIYFCRQKAIH